MVHLVRTGEGGGRRQRVTVAHGVDPGRLQDHGPGLYSQHLQQLQIGKSLSSFPQTQSHYYEKKKEAGGQSAVGGVRVLTNEMVMLVHRPRPRGVQMLD